MQNYASTKDHLVRPFILICTIPFVVEVVKGYRQVE
jgi:hypothetical protein